MNDKPKRYRPVMLMVLDGFGYRKPADDNAISLARTPNISGLFAKYPHTLLTCSGRAVGLPAGVMGNSEVGHLNIGAGRVVKQEVVRIDDTIADGSFFDNPALCEAIAKAGTQGAIHLMGLVSDGKVHSSDAHYFALLEMMKRKGVPGDRVFFHVLLDGRDTPPTSGIGYVEALANCMKKLGVGRIATIGGRYWAMDRDKRWDRVEKGYRAFTEGEGVLASDPVQAMRDAYARGENDEFVKPIVFGRQGELFDGRIKDGDGLIFFNFRGDRARQIAHAFLDSDFKGFERRVWPKVHYVCFTEYDETIHTPIAFPSQPMMKNIYGEVLANAGLKQLRVAETEKYAHVTFFFNGGEEKPFPGEERILVPSPKVATYDLQPEMSAFGVRDKLLAAIESNAFDAVVVNFANCDMVGHTGVLPAAIKAVEAVDQCVGAVVDAVLKAGGAVLITADHGNAEQMRFADGQTHTQHTTDPVPLLYVVPGAEDTKLREGGALCDIAPTLLELLGLPKPAEMTGRSVRV